MNNQDNFQPDEGQLKALVTWYPVDHPLHYGLHHPLMKLVGELGEYIDLLAKKQYKPGKIVTDEMIEAELGDIWFYIRIIAYLSGETIESASLFSDTHPFDNSDPEEILFGIMYSASSMLYCFRSKEFMEIDFLYDVVGSFKVYVKRLGYTLDRLTQSNYLKLVDPETGKGRHGWKSQIEYNTLDVD